MVEFALVAPMFFFALFGIIEAGRFIFYYETLNNATREGARYAIVNGANTIGCPTGPPAPGSTSCDPAGDDVRERVRDAAFGVLSPITVDPVWHDPINNGRGSTVTVSATFTYRSLVPLVPLPPITITAESSLVINN
jgi:TadE-like protein